MAKLSIRDLELNNKYLFVRVDFNVPLSESGTADSRRYPDQRDLAHARVRAAPSRQSDRGLAPGASQRKTQS